MKYIFFILLLFFSPFLSVAQKEHLEPTDVLKDNIYKGSYSGIFSLLYEGYSKEPTARYTSIPSFSKEYSFSVDGLQTIDPDWDV